MNKQEFIKLINDVKRGQQAYNELLKTLELEVLWWFTQEPKTGHYDGVDYPVETADEFWEYIQICEKNKEI